MKYFPGKSLAAVLAAAMLSPLLCGCTRVLPEDYVNPFESSGAQSSQSEESSQPSEPEIPEEIPPSSSEPDEEEDGGSEEPASSSEPEEKVGYVPAMNADYAQLEGIPTAPVTWGPGRQGDDKNRPYGSTSCQDQYGKYCAYFIAPDSEKVYLTFDEGYEAEGRYTEKILDTLKEKDAKAVFFITGDYARRNGDLVQRMIDEGHIVGSHSWSHPSNPAMPGLAVDKSAEELTKLHDYVKENFNYEMSLFRFPAGEFSEQTLALVQDMGYQSVFWSFAYRDWETNNQMSREDAMKEIQGRAHPGAIYLLHAVSSTNAEILGDVIDWLREQGYTISEYDLPYFERGAE